MRLCRITCFASLTITASARPLDDAGLSAGSVSSSASNTMPSFGTMHVKPLGQDDVVVITDSVSDMANGVQIPHTDQSMTCIVAEEVEGYSTTSSAGNIPCANNSPWYYQWMSDGTSKILKITHWVKYKSSAQSPDGGPVWRRRDATKAVAGYNYLKESDFIVCEHEVTALDQYSKTFDYIEGSTGPAVCV